MTQDRKSGANAVEYGIATAKEIAKELGAIKVGNPRSNEYELAGKKIVLKCAKSKTTNVGVAYHMLERLEAIYGCFETDDDSYDIYKLPTAIYSENMRPTRSKGASAGRVGIVSKKLFLTEGEFIQSIKLAR
jgi:hypothetical protein